MKNIKKQGKIGKVGNKDRVRGKQKIQEKASHKKRKQKIQEKPFHEKRRQKTKVNSAQTTQSANVWDAIIVGAGAAGMTAALSCGKQGQQVLLIERQAQMGRKILATGNGKCNLTNFVQKEECYRSDCPARAQKVLAAFGQAEAMELFRSLGIYTKDKNGYVYPYSEQAASVRDAFEAGIMSDSNITFLSESEVYDVGETRGVFHVTVRSVADEKQIEKQSTKREQIEKKQQYHCKSLLITTGGLAGPKFGCDGSGYRMAEQFGHKVVSPLPALTALKSSAPFLKKVSGVRNQAAITLEIDGKTVKQETGELQWTEYGISGVAIFQLSRFAIIALEKNKKVSLYFDFMPELSSEEKLRLFLTLAQQNKKKDALSFAKGFFPAKLCPVILREAGISEEKALGSLEEKDWDAFVLAVSHFSLRINGYVGYEKAQVTRGGITLTELTDSLESIKQPGLFFAGEVTDVDGTCGGYNLQWAFSSGTVAGRAIVKRNQKLSFSK